MCPLFGGVARTVWTARQPEGIAVVSLRKDGFAPGDTAEVV